MTQSIDEGDACSYSEEQTLRLQNWTTTESSWSTDLLPYRSTLYCESLGEDETDTGAKTNCDQTAGWRSQETEADLKSNARALEFSLYSRRGWTRAE